MHACRIEVNAKAPPNYLNVALDGVILVIGTSLANEQTAKLIGHTYCENGLAGIRRLLRFGKFVIGITGETE